MMHGVILSVIECIRPQNAAAGDDSSVAMLKFSEAAMSDQARVKICPSHVLERHRVMAARTASFTRGIRDPTRITSTRDSYVLKDSLTVQAAITHTYPRRLDDPNISVQPLHRVPSARSPYRYLDEWWSQAAKIAGHEMTYQIV